MKILHICSDFAKQSIYNQLITHLSQDGNCSQFIFVPCRSIEEIGKNKNIKLNNVQYFYCKILNKFDRLLFRRKIIKTTKAAMNFQKNADIVHAHFLFSDGAIALEYYYKFNTPYIVAVRNTDINYFFKYMIHLRNTGIEILKHASKIIFLSSSYKFQLLNNYIPNDIRKDIESKSLVIPNGVAPFWIENIFKSNKILKNPISIVYVGDFSKNKNIQNTISALSLMRKNGLQIIFSIVGGGGDYQNQIFKLIRSNSSWIKYFPRTNNKSELKSIFQESHIFCMPSKFETFGLAYIEAMTQGLPVVFTKNQGIDGYFEAGEIGVAVENNNIENFILGIHEILNNYKFMSNNCLKHSKLFSWDIISHQYLELYKSLI